MQEQRFVKVALLLIACIHASDAFFGGSCECFEINQLGTVYERICPATETGETGLPLSEHSVCPIGDDFLVDLCEFHAPTITVREGDLFPNALEIRAECVDCAPRGPPGGGGGEGGEGKKKREDIGLEPNSRIGDEENEETGESIQEENDLISSGRNRRGIKMKRRKRQEQGVQYAWLPWGPHSFCYLSAVITAGVETKGDSAECRISSSGLLNQGIVANNPFDIPRYGEHGAGPFLGASATRNEAAFCGARCFQYQNLKRSPEFLGDHHTVTTYRGQIGFENKTIASSSNTICALTGVGGIGPWGNVRTRGKGKGGGGENPAETKRGRGANSIQSMECDAFNDGENWILYSGYYSEELGCEMRGKRGMRGIASRGDVCLERRKPKGGRRSNAQVMCEADCLTFPSYIDVNEMIEDEVFLSLNTYIFKRGGGTRQFWDSVPLYSTKTHVCFLNYVFQEGQDEPLGRPRGPGDSAFDYANSLTGCSVNFSGNGTIWELNAFVNSRSGFDVSVECAATCVDVSAILTKEPEYFDSSD